MDGWMDHEFRRSLLTVVAKIEGLWDAKKEMGIVKAEQAEGLTLERKEEKEEEEEEKKKKKKKKNKKNKKWRRRKLRTTLQPRRSEGGWLYCTSRTVSLGVTATFTVCKCH
jgi:hypothetical protein